MIWLVGVLDVIDAAGAMDRVFWSDGIHIDAGQVKDDDAWAVARDRMEVARLDFINAARGNVVRSLVPVTDLPVARPPLAELIRLSQPDPEPAGAEEAPGQATADLP